MLLEDTDMQACMIQTLWTLNLKLDKYYNRTGTTYRLHEDKEVILMSVSNWEIKRECFEF